MMISDESHLIYLLIDKNQIDVGQRRLFFDQFAKDYNFDPLEPSNWYHVTLRSLLAKEVCSLVLYSLSS